MLHALSQIKIVVFKNIGRGTYSELIWGFKLILHYYDC